MSERWYDQSNSSKDVVTQPTPVASKIIHKMNTNKEFGVVSDISEMESKALSDIQIQDGVEIKLPSSSHDSITQENQDESASDDSSSNGDMNLIVKRSPEQTRTPNLNRLRDFLLENRSPGQGNLLRKLKAIRKEDSDVSESSNNIILPENNKSSKKIEKDIKLDIQDSHSMSDVESGNTTTLDTHITLEKFNYSPPDTPESERLTPNNDFKQIERIIDSPTTESKNGQVKEHNTTATDTLKNIKIVTHSIEEAGNNLLIVPAEEETQTIEKHNTKGDTFRKISLHRKESSNLLIDENDNEGIIGNDVTKSKLNQNTTIDEEQYIDDTTADANISNQWIFRPDGGANTSESFDKTTQLIHSIKTQLIESQPEVQMDTQINIHSIPSMSTQHDKTQILKSETQLIEKKYAKQKITQNTSSSTDHQIEIEAQSIHDINEDRLSTQEDISKIQTGLSQFDTPLNTNKTNIEPILEVPETSSPSKIIHELNVAEAIESSTSSPSPQERRSSSKNLVFLKVSSKPNLLPSSINENDYENTMKYSTIETRADNIIMSDAEMTQELPELPEGEVEESQRILVGRRKSKRSIEGLEVSQENSNTIATLLHTQGQKTAFPSKIREEDKQLLTKENIVFEEAVWCQYSINFHFYPGIIESRDPETNMLHVLFETDELQAKDEDTYHLDIRVGDSVKYNGSPYKVTALECCSHNERVVRCIRGYDTVHLKKKNSSNSDQILIVPLSSIYIDLDEWVKRRKIVLDPQQASKFQNKQIQPPKESTFKRKKKMSLSPRKKQDVNYKESSDDDDFGSNNDDPVFEPKEIPHVAPVKSKENILHSIPSGSNHNGFILNSEEVDSKTKADSVPDSNILENNHPDQHVKIFENCIFVLTSLFENRDEIRDLIEAEGGYVIDLGFSNLFSYSTELNDHTLKEFQLQLEWKKYSKIANYRLACLITKKYLRSPKYLETLALGWPTLHWRFIHECLSHNRLMYNLIPNYLLPSGESSRLRLDDSSDSMVVKSSNIFKFYTNLLAGETLDSQVYLTNDLMNDFIVIICGNSNLTEFVKFVFACFGVKRLYQLVISECSENFIDNLETVKEAVTQCENINFKLLFYLNADKSNFETARMVGKVQEELATKLDTSVSYYVEYKEWLIQTIINGSTGFPV